MVTQRVRIPCPNCSHGLRIRAEDLGRKGECKYCGYQFRPQARLSPDPSSRRTVPGVASPDYRPADLGQWVDTLERRLEKSWARLTAKQLSVVEQLMVALGNPSAQSGLAVKQRAGAPSPLSSDRSPRTHRVSSGWANGVEPPDEELAADTDESDRLEVRFEDASAAQAPIGPSVREGVLGVTEGKFEIVGTGTDMFQFQGEMPIIASARAMPAANIVECVNRLARERDEAQAQCARLAHEVDRVRDKLAERLHEVARLQKKADRLRTVRAERDQLNAERTMLAREATQLQARMVEAQVALVEVGAELDECRERLSTERQDWQDQRRQLIEEGERHQAEIDRLRAALEEAETQECLPLIGG